MQLKKEEDNNSVNTEQRFENKEPLIGLGGHLMNGKS